MPGDRSPLIALVEWHEPGHHFTWFCTMVRAFLNIGCRVAAFCPDPDAVRDALLAEVPPQQLECIRFVPFSYPVPPRVRPLALRPWVQRRTFAHSFREGISRLEREFDDRIDLVYFSALFEFEEKAIDGLLNKLDRPWTGMLMHARSGSDPTRTTLAALLAKHGPRNMTVIDEGFAPAVEKDLGAPTIVLPDFTDETFLRDHPIEQRLKRFAGSDRLVLQVGHLRQDKGVGTLAQVALSPDTEGLAFAFVGKVDWFMGPETRSWLGKAMNLSSKSIFHLEELPDEIHYNAVVRSCDVMFAAYENFPHSSNSLAKAAAFRKPIIVSDGHLMADRVREFRMGEVVPYGDPLATLDAIRRITDDLAGWCEAKQPRWSEYQALHSFRTLCKGLEQVIEAA